MVDKINGVWSGADKPPWSSSVTFEDVRRCAKCAEGLANEAARQTSTSYFKATVMLMDQGHQVSTYECIPSTRSGAKIRRRKGLWEKSKLSSAT